MSNILAMERLALAQARADAARAQLSATVGRLQERAQPAALLNGVTSTAKVRGADAMAKLVDTVSRKPQDAGIAVTVVGLFLARHRIGRIFDRMKRRLR